MLVLKSPPYKTLLFLGVSFVLSLGWGVVTDRTWTGDKDDQWFDMENWGYTSAPDIGTERAVFPTSGASTRTVTYTSGTDRTIHSIIFNNAGSDAYTLNFTSSLGNTTLTLSDTNSLINNGSEPHNLKVKADTSSQYSSLSLKNISNSSLNPLFFEVEGGDVLLNTGEISGPLRVDTSYAGSRNGSLKIVGNVEKATEEAQFTINNIAIASNQYGSTRLDADSSLTNANIYNYGGNTQVVGDASFINTRVRNDLDDDFTRAGRLLVNMNCTLTLDENSVITNKSVDGESLKGFTSVEGTIGGGSIHGDGGYTLVKSTGTLNNVILTPSLENSDQSYTAIQGDANVSIASFYMPAYSPDGELNGAKLYGHNAIILYDEASLPLTGTDLKIIISDGLNYNNQTNSLVFKASNADTSTVTGTFNSVTFVNQDLEPIAALDYTLSFESGDPEEAFTDITLPDGTVVTDGLVPLLRLTISAATGLTETVKTVVRAAANTVADTGQQLAGRVNTIVRAAMNYNGWEVSSEDIFKKPRHHFTGVADTLSFKAPSLESPTLSTTDAGASLTARDNLDRFSPLRTQSTAIWAQPFGHTARQGSTTHTHGYTGKTSGLLVGMDHRSCPHLLVGGAVGSALTTAELSGDNGKTQIKNKLITVFGRYLIQEPWYVEGIFTASHNRIRASRAVNTTTKASHSHEGYQLVPSVGIGHEGIKWKNGFSIAPYLNASLVYSHEDKYVEEGAGANNQIVNERCANQFLGEVGFNLRKTHEHTFGKALYEIGIGAIVTDPWKKGAINGTVNGNGFGISSNEKTETYGTLRLSSQFLLDNDWFATVNYGAEVGTKYTAHEGAIRIGRKL